MNKYRYEKLHRAGIAINKRKAVERAMQTRESCAIVEALAAQGLPDATERPCEPWLYERDVLALASRLTREEGVQHRAVRCESCPGWHVEEVP